MVNKETNTLTGIITPAVGDLLPIFDINDTAELKSVILLQISDLFRVLSRVLNNQTFSIDLNSLIADTPSAGKYLRDNGTKFVSAALQIADLDTDPLARANHTGTQLASTISDFDTQVKTNKLDTMAAPTDITTRDATTLLHGLMPKLDKVKFDGIEALADVTDNTNVNAAGATMNTDTDVKANSYVIDEDNMLSDLDTKVPTQQSVKAHVAAEIATALTSDITLIGDYNAAINTPDLDVAPSGIIKGDYYVVTAAGNFFTESIAIGDTLIAKQDNPTLLTHWILTGQSLTAVEIKTLYESNADTNKFSDAEQTKLTGIETAATIDQTDLEIKTALENNADTNTVTDTEKTVIGNLSGTNTGDEPDSSATVKGISELATIAEIDTGIDTGRTITPAGLAGSALQSKVDGIESSATADQTDAEIETAYNAQVSAMPSTTAKTGTSTTIQRVTALRLREAAEASRKEVQIILLDSTVDATVGDDVASVLFNIGPLLAGMNLVSAEAVVATAGTTGTLDIQIRNKTQAVDMLTNKIQVASAAILSDNGELIDTLNDNVALNDQLAVDFDVIHTTPSKGCTIILGFESS